MVMECYALAHPAMIDNSDMNLPCATRPEALLSLIPAGLTLNPMPGIPWTFKSKRETRVCVEIEGHRMVLRKRLR